MSDHPVLIVGGGPGGLTTALALQHVGISARVLERAPALRTAGAGLTLQINAMRMLEALDARAAVAAAGEPLRSLRVANAHGRVITSMEMASFARRFGGPGVMIHRGALSQRLADALAPETLRFDSNVVSFTQDADGVTLTLEDQTQLRARAVIGADGIHSRIRAGLFGERPLRYAGYTCWRGIASCSRPLGEGVASERWGRGTRFGIVPISATETYWFATANAPAGGSDGDDPQAELLARFAEFGDPVSALIESTPAPVILRNDIVDLAPLSRWTTGRVALLGDAAHAMTPNMGQGACQAIEDAVVLASCLAERGDQDTAAGLAEYERLRMARARSFVDRSLRLGAAGQWSNPLAVWLRELGARLAPAAIVERGLEAAWQVEVPKLDARRALAAKHRRPEVRARWPQWAGQRAAHGGLAY
ncbi:FAD-dependent monooxygenase [Pseudenhygromyxa sp. WMMC2535]|uniref:FAD-dependent monooxygenase n=1 Tax=Pseudenhygromyxa sp. WMMC2535 TaxID=2712867 RepID=UPI00155424F9|nr:FAD-dependent monooxygenase [Pseudenhygromyxa sp. WMMC2535]NVB41374.1 FAD-dependent monooxygenase [Pseudenhygromyxa sp. WMMC2535]